MVAPQKQDRIGIYVCTNVFFLSSKCRIKGSEDMSTYFDTPCIFVIVRKNTTCFHFQDIITYSLEYQIFLLDSG